MPARPTGADRAPQVASPPMSPIDADPTDTNPTDTNPTETDPSDANPTDDDLADLAERLFAAFVAHDLDAVEAMLAPGAAFTQNGRTSTFAESRPMLEALPAILGDHRYENVRRVTGRGVVVEEHDVVSTTPRGKAVKLAACVVVRVDDHGRITSLDEYVDGSRVRA